MIIIKELLVIAANENTEILCFK